MSDYGIATIALALEKVNSGPALLAKTQEVKADGSADKDGPRASVSYTCRC